MIRRPKSQMYGFYCINGLRMAQFEKLSNKKIFEVKILKGWHNLHKKEPKMRFLTILSGLTGLTGLLLHILIAKIDTYLLIVIQVMGCITIYS